MTKADATATYKFEGLPAGTTSVSNVEGGSYPQISVLSKIVISGSLFEEISNARTSSTHNLFHS